MEKRANIYLLLILLTIISKIQSQDISNTKFTYIHSAYRQQCKLFTTYLVSEKHTFKLFKPDSTGIELLNESPDSKILLRRIKNVTALVSALALAGSLCELYAPSMEIKNKHRPFPRMLFAGGLVMLGAVVPLQIRANNLSNKFVWTFNRDIILNRSTVNTSHFE